VALEYTTYHLELRPRQSIRLPEFAGSLVRGTFGKALRELTCATRAPTCADCALAAACVYREVFDPLPPAAHDLQRFSAIPAPYVLHLSDWGEQLIEAGTSFCFGITLIGRKRRHLPLVLLALQRAASAGWTRAQTRFDLHRVTASSEAGQIVVLQPGAHALLPHGATATLTAATVERAMQKASTSIRLAVELLTPARLQQEGRPARAGELQARTWLMAVIRRIGLLADFHGEAALPIDFRRLAALAEQCAIVEHELRWHDWDRYSGRQKQVMPMGGLVGRMRIEGPLAPFLELVQLAAPLHAGKHAAFGLGAYLVSVPELPSGGQRR